ncbi:enoyl-CoA hydratase domain-containing protein 3, mitochondrial-like [Mercenaria mercenaria]|uniref:enoyl-CoA hydratase domain-containing protein 3, mitochondrial-like n=1 Tax=Mercenaria mercenaria TaxID=6596 RepID=UPI00234ED9BF|nr:enoyl-CoA hydratase domain-containing protein 3, mitochondrial-like [Mercenaria mercenaria]
MASSVVTNLSRILNHQSKSAVKRFSTCILLRSQEAKQYTLTQEVDGIRTICLNDVKKRNALSLGMLKELQQNIYKDSEDLRVIILTHNGPVFSAGHDLKELTSKEGRAYHMEVFSTCTAMMSSLQDLPVPVIASVSGLATAAGCQLVASCDIAIATEKSAFATPGVNVGLFCSTPAVAVGRSVPRKVAMEMLFTGQPITAQGTSKSSIIFPRIPRYCINLLYYEIINVLLLEYFNFQHLLKIFKGGYSWAEPPTIQAGCMSCSNDDPSSDGNHRGGSKGFELRNHLKHLDNSDPFKTLLSASTVMYI